MSLLIVTGVSAEVVQEKGLRVAFRAGFSPIALPREEPKPVTLHLSMSIATANGGRPPQLTRVAVGVNRHGRLLTRGLPSCPDSALQSMTTQAVLDRCRAALVGTGSFAAKLDLAGDTVPVQGRLLAFNGSGAGRHLFLLHFYASSPVPVTMVIPFRVSRGKGGGELSTLLSARIPRLAGGTGYVTGIRLRLGRRFTYHGRHESLFSASCAAPAGFNSVPFALARGQFQFANGQRLSTTLTRQCHVLRPGPAG